MPPDGASGSEQLSAVQLDELRHRLRNHLQNMTSLISLQIRRAQHPETIQALQDLRARFSALTSIYIDLDDAGDRPVALDHFVPELVWRIGELYDPNRQHAATLVVAPLALPGQRAAFLGQIVVELVMNAYRHAFAGRTGGAINVDLAVSDGDATLTIADDGPGMTAPDGGRLHLGFSITSRLASALGGTFEHESRGGFVARVRFPLNLAGAPS